MPRCDVSMMPCALPIALFQAQSEPQVHQCHGHQGRCRRRLQLQEVKMALLPQMLGSRALHPGSAGRRQQMLELVLRSSHQGVMVATGSPKRWTSGNARSVRGGSARSASFVLTASQRRPHPVRGAMLDMALEVTLGSVSIVLRSGKERPLPRVGVALPQGRSRRARGARPTKEFTAKQEAGGRRPSRGRACHPKALQRHPLRPQVQDTPQQGGTRPRLRSLVPRQDNRSQRTTRRTRPGDSSASFSQWVSQRRTQGQP